MVSRIRRIVYASDFSRARPAFAKAVDLAKAYRAELFVLHVLSIVPPFVGEGYIAPRLWEELETGARAAAQSQLDWLVAKARKAGLRAKGLVVLGSPYEDIVRAARRQHADLLVMGTHGRTGLTTAARERCRACAEDVHLSGDDGTGRLAINGTWRGEVAEPVIETQGLEKDYWLGAHVVQALRGVSLTIEAGELVAIMGPSGSGKSTLMSILGCLDTPTAGCYLLEGQNVSELDDDALASIRNAKIGFVFSNSTCCLDERSLPTWSCHFL
jgi:nucleotide-binding universal stress UspA family protein